MKIRTATYHDAAAIKLLMATLGYKTSVSLLVDQLENLFDGINHQVFVYELGKDVVGFISVHFIPQLAFEGEVVFISYLSVDDTIKDQGIAKALEHHITQVAIKRKCDRIQVHFQDRRAADQQFFQQQGYTEYQEFYSKRLIYGE